MSTDDDNDPNENPYLLNIPEINNITDDDTVIDSKSTILNIQGIHSKNKYISALFLLYNCRY